jgi:hypothetical protein
MNHFDVCITASACMADLRDTQGRKALPAGSSRAAERGPLRAGGGGDRTASRQCVGVAINAARFTRFPFCVHGYMPTIYNARGESETLYSNI